jgi:hypothetical protein
MNSIIHSRDIEGSRMVMLRFPAAAIKGAGPALAAAMAEEGWLVTGHSSRSWRFESIVGEGDDAFLVGPYAFKDVFEGADSRGADTNAPSPESLGAPIASLDDVGGIEKGMSLLLAAARALSSLSAEGRLPRGVISSGVIFGPQEGQVLILPPTAVSRALAAQGARARSMAVARLLSPRSDGPDSDASFLLAQAAYRYASGSGAYEKEAGEPSSLAGQERSSPEAELAAPSLDPALAQLIDRSLADPRDVTLSEWIAALSAGEQARWVRDLDPEQAKTLARRKEAHEAESRARQRRSDFFRKRRTMLIAIAAAAAVVAAVGADMVRAQRERPDFSSLAPLELAQRYYVAVDGLDLESMEACGGAKAIGADRDYVLNLFVVTKTRAAYEGKSPVVRASDWVAAGKPPLAQTDLLYGIVGLKLTSVPNALSADAAPPSAPAPAITLQATYSIWFLTAKEDPSGDPSKSMSIPTEEKRIDVLGIARVKKGWQIVSLRRTIQS